MIVNGTCFAVASHFIKRSQTKVFFCNYLTLNVGWIYSFTQAHTIIRHKLFFSNCHRVYWKFFLEWKFRFKFQLFNRHRWLTDWGANDGNFSLQLWGSGIQNFQRCIETNKHLSVWNSAVEGWPIPLDWGKHFIARMVQSKSLKLEVVVGYCFR